MSLRELGIVAGMLAMLGSGLYGIDITYARQSTVAVIVTEITGLRLDSLYARMSQLLQIKEKRELTIFEKQELRRIMQNIVRLNGKI